jgi:hypothetical protein
LLQEELYTILIDFDHDLDLDLDEVIFQQDNASARKAKIIQEWFWKQPYIVMDWPAQSPNLNPIEYVGAILKEHLNLYFIPLKNLYK